MTHQGEVYGRAKPRLVPHGVRAVVALALVLCGVGAIVYAAAFHVIPVQSGPAEPEAARPAAVMESEPALVKEVSVGGVMLAGSGDIQRTYSGQPPSQCPT